MEGVDEHFFFYLFLREKGDEYVTENQYQSKLIKKLYRLFPGCVVIKNDPSYQQGILDLMILWGPVWASLEVKASADARVQPNQEHFVRVLDDMGFAAFIYPENEAEVLDALEQAFENARRTCVLKP
jgi:hypothetical protein